MSHQKQKNLNRRAFLHTGVCACLAPAGSWAASAGELFEDSQLICGFGGYPTFKSTKAVHKATPEALQAVQLIIDAVGIEQNFEVLRGEFTRKVGGFATIRGNKRYIVYDQDEFTFANGRTDWIGMGLLAHESGHHLAAHVHLNGTSSQAQELEADRFAGVALARLGASKDQALMWTAGLSETGGKTHPPRVERVVAATEGWELGRRQVAFEGRCQTTDWEAPVFDVEGRQCRVARICEGGQTSPRLACEDYKGDWVWQRQLRK